MLTLLHPGDLPWLVYLMTAVAFAFVLGFGALAAYAAYIGGQHLDQRDHKE